MGKLGRDLGVEDGYAAARLTGLNLLQTARSAIGSLDRIGGIVEVFGTVSSAPEFTQQSRVVNGCSDLLMHVFGEHGRHSCMAIGVAALPFDWAVEVKLIAELS